MSVTMPWHTYKCAVACSGATLSLSATAIAMEVSWTPVR